MMSALLILSGCSSDPSTGKSNNGTDASPGKQEEEKQEEVVITLWGADNFLKDDASPGGQSIKEFNEKYKGKIRVELTYMPHEQLNTAMQAAFSTKDMPDVFLTPHGVDIRSLAFQDLILPLNEIVSEDWTKQFLEGAFLEGKNVIDGNIYSWPTAGPEMMSMLYYNQDLLSEAGYSEPPRTWDELKEMAKNIADKGQGNVYGIVFGGAVPINSYKRIILGLAGNTSKEIAFDYQNGSYAYNRQDIVDATKLLKQMREDEAIHPASYTMKPPEAMTLFAQGQSAFYIAPRWMLNQIKDSNPDMNLGLTYTPQKDGNPPVYGYTPAQDKSYVVSKSTKHPKEVGIFIEESFASKSFYERYVTFPIGLSPMPEVNQNESLFPYPEFNTFVELHDTHLRVEPDFAGKNPEIAKVINEIGGMEQTRVKPSFPEIIQMYILGKEDDIERALNDYNEKLNEGLASAVETVKAQGANVSTEDFKFPNWNPLEDFTTEYYEALK